jgi:hypothetical protein
VNEKNRFFCDLKNGRKLVDLNTSLPVIYCGIKLKLKNLLYMSKNDARSSIIQLFLKSTPPNDTITVNITSLVYNCRRRKVLKKRTICTYGNSASSRGKQIQDKLGEIPFQLLQLYKEYIDPVQSGYISFGKNV